MIHCDQHNKDKYKRSRLVKTKYRKVQKAKTIIASKNRLIPPLSKFKTKLYNIEIY